MQSLVEYIKVVRELNRNARLFLVHTVLAGLGLSLLVLLYNLYILSLGFKQDMIGFVTLVACAVAVIAALPLGMALQTLGYRRALALGALGTAASIALPLLIPTGEALIATEFIWGVGFSLLIIGGGPFMTENSTPHQRAHFFSIQFVLATLTAFVGNLIGGEMPRWFGNWLGVGAESPHAYQGALAVAVLLILLSVIPLLFIRNEPVSRMTTASPRLKIRNRAVITRLLTPFILGAFSAGMIVPFANVLWKTTQNLSDASIGNVFALSALLTAGLGLLAPMLTRRFGHVRVMVIVQGVTVVGTLAFGFVPWLGVAVAGYLLRDVLWNLMRPLFGQFMMEVSEPVERGTVSALGSMGFNLAWGVSSEISGAWQTDNQLGLMILVSASFYVISTIALYWFFGQRSGRREKERVTRTLGSPAE